MGLALVGGCLVFYLGFVVGYGYSVGLIFVIGGGFVGYVVFGCLFLGVCLRFGIGLGISCGVC